jgi:hypothetical protein
VAVAMTAVENRVAVDSGDNIILRVKFFAKFNKRLQHYVNILDLGGSAWSGRHFRFEDSGFFLPKPKDKTTSCPINHERRNVRKRRLRQANQANNLQTSDSPTIRGTSF